jgi:methylenetetrahydrofolate reductase (NADPH)
MGRLRDRLSAGERVVTVELAISDAASRDPVLATVSVLKDRVDGISVTDNAGAHAHASSLAVSSLVADAGAEPVMNLACRDRNRLALQGELLGAALHGIENVVCVTGDDITSGDEPQAKRVFDLDSPQLLSVASTLQDGRFLSGRPIDPAPRFFLGAVENPTAPPLAYRAERALKKVLAGAQFFQLQIAFAPEPVEAFLNASARLGLCDRVSFLPSICILRSARQLRYMHERVAGVVAPEDVLAEAEAVPPAAQREHCMELAVSLARAALELPWVSGLHLIPLGGPELAIELLDRLGADATRRKEHHGNGSRVPV